MTAEWAQVVILAVATLGGPILAVYLSLRMQSRQQLRERRTQLLRMLIGSRKDPGNIDYGLAISLIPTEFNRHPGVLDAREALLKRSQDGETETDAKLNEIDNLVSDLVAEMLGALGYDIPHAKVRELTYVPNIQGWRARLQYDAMLAQLHIANNVAKSTSYSKLIAEKATGVETVPETNIPFPNLEDQGTKP